MNRNKLCFNCGTAYVYESIIPHEYCGTCGANKFQSMHALMVGAEVRGATVGLNAPIINGRTREVIDTLRDLKQTIDELNRANLRLTNEKESLQNQLNNARRITESVPEIDYRPPLTRLRQINEMVASLISDLIDSEDL